MLACDGIFDVLSSEAALAYMRARLTNASSLREALNDFLDHVLLLGSNDNVTVLVVLFPAAAVFAPHLFANAARLNESIVLAPGFPATDDRPVQLDR